MCFIKRSLVHFLIEEVPQDTHIKHRLLAEAIMCVHKALLSTFLIEEVPTRHPH